MSDILQTLLDKITEIESQIKADDFVDDSSLYNKLITTLKVLENRLKTQNSLLLIFPT